MGDYGRRLVSTERERERDRERLKERLELKWKSVYIERKVYIVSVTQSQCV